MRFSSNQLHWLDLAEYVALGLTVISLVFAIALKIFWLILICVTLCLFLNFLNRWRFQYIYKKRLSCALRQIQNQGVEIEELNNKVAALSLASKPVKVSPPTSLSLFRENLVILENSVNGIVQYLNNHAFRERIENLELLLEQLKQEIYPQLSSFAQAQENNSEVSSRQSPTINSPEVSGNNSLPSIKLPSFGEPVAVPSWQCLHILKEHKEAVSGVAISPDGKLLAAVSWDQSLCVWNLQEGKLLASIIGHSQGVLTVVFTGANPYTLATGSFDQTIKLWSLVAASEIDHNWQLELKQTLTAHTGSVHTLATILSRSLLVSGSYDQTVKQWDLNSGEMLASSLDNLGAIYAIALLEENQLIASAGGDGKVVLWELINGKKRGILGGNVSSVESLALSPDEEIIAAGCVDGTIKLWQLDPSLLPYSRPPQPIRVLSAHRGQVHALLFSQTEQLLFSSGADGVIKIWHPSSKESIHSLTLSESSQDHAQGVFSLALSDDSQILVAGGVDGIIKVWHRE